MAKLEDNETIKYLKIVKDSKNNKNDWWNDLTEEQKRGIPKGLKDIEEGRVFSHEEVRRKYGLRNLLVRSIFIKS